MPIRRLPVAQDGEEFADHELIVNFPATGARWPSEVLLRGADGHLGRVTTSLLKFVARRENLLPSTTSHPVQEQEEDEKRDAGGNQHRTVEWPDIRQELLELYLATPVTRPAEFESHLLDPLLKRLRRLVKVLNAMKKELEDLEDPSALAEISLLQAENNEVDGVIWGDMVFVESERTGLRVARSANSTFFLLTMRDQNQSVRVFDNKGFEHKLENGKRVRKEEAPYGADNPWGVRWPIQAASETRPREIAATIAAFNARCSDNNATEAYTKCAEKLGIKGDQAPQEVFKAMRRLITTLRKPEFHDEIRFLAEPNIKVDSLIKSVKSPDFQRLV